MQPAPAVVGALAAGRLYTWLDDDDAHAVDAILQDATRTQTRSAATSVHCALASAVWLLEDAFQAEERRTDHSTLEETVLAYLQAPGKPWLPLQFGDQTRFIDAAHHFALAKPQAWDWTNMHETLRHLLMDATTSIAVTMGTAVGLAHALDALFDDFACLPTTT